MRWRWRTYNTLLDLANLIEDAGEWAASAVERLAAWVRSGA